MYCLRLFIVVLQELHCLLFTVKIVVCLLKSMCIPSFVLIGCCVSELHGHLCPYRNVLPHVTKFRCSTPSGFRDSYMYCLRLFIILLLYKNYIVYYSV